MQRQLELPPDVALVDGVEIQANLLRGQNTGAFAGLADVSSRYHRSRVHRYLLHFDRIIEHLFHHAAKLHGSGNAAMIALAVPALLCPCSTSSASSSISRMLLASPPTASSSAAPKGGRSSCNGAIAAPNYPSAASSASATALAGGRASAVSVT